MIPSPRCIPYLPILIAAVCLQPAFGQKADPPRVHVLFLGDDGHHEPAQRVREILPYMAGRGINIVYTDRLEHLNQETLRRYDVLALYGNHEHLSRAEEAALLNYVEEGGGLVAIHSASAMFGNSDAYISLVGGAFKSHGTGVFQTRTIRPDHPAIQGVAGFESWDETYVHMKLNPDAEVLAVREENGREEPWSWVRSHGDGRVFYTASGHDDRTWSHPSFRLLLERGVRWAGGALTADLAPRALDYEEGLLPYYPPGAGWGITGDPITRVQKPLTPEASMQQVFLEPGFRLDLFAAEPDIVNPIDMAWDERGRLWIVETIDYPNEFEPERRGNDRIKILEDTDSDGRADKVTIFAEGLNIPTSLALAHGGVIVAQAPDMLFLKDNDGDDRADVKQVLFTGWGTFDTHAGPSNLRYGFDNHVWGAVGYSGFNGSVAGDSIRIIEGLYRFAPDGSSLELTALTNNNTWGLGFSEEGLVFASTANGNPSNFMAIPGRYYARLKHRPRSNPDDEREVPVLHPIADVANIYTVTEDVRQVDWHGRYTAAAGFEIYTARSFPREYWNRAAFVSEPPGHLLGKFFLEPKGGDFTASNEWNMVASRDAWFAPIQARVGPDGALWFIDWYNLVIQHNPTPPGFETGKGNAYENELRDRQHSRIYRLAYDEAPEYRPIGLGDAGPRDLVRALRQDNMHWRLTAQRLLVERGQLDVLPELMTLVRDERVDGLGLNVAAIHALWTMHGLGAFEDGDREAVKLATDALHHPSAGVRRAAAMVLPAAEESLHALLELLPDRSGPGGTEYTVPGAAMDPDDAQVRLAVLLAISDMPSSEDAGSRVAEMLLIPENANDRWLREAAAIAGSSHSKGFLRSVLREEPGASDSTYIANVGYAVEMAAAHYAAGSRSDRFISLFSALPGAHPRLARAFLDGMVAGWPAGESPELGESDRAALRAMSNGLPHDQLERLNVLADRWGNPDLFSAEY